MPTTFLASYFDSLARLKFDPNVDFVKGNMRVNHSFPMMHATCDSNAISRIPWLPPCQGRVKLNTDGSILSGKVGVRLVLRNHLGSIIFSACGYLGDYDDVLES